MQRLITVLVLVLFATPAWAEWTLSPDQSHLSFGSIKKGSVGEVHHFTKISGTVSDEGNARITIDLASVATGIEIRNERMRKVLFQTDKFPTATITADLDMVTFETLALGDTATVNVPVTLELHGKTSHVDTELVVARLGVDRVLVVPQEFIMIDAGAYGFDDGIAKLMKLAGLPSISSAVPVSFVFVFTRKIE